MANIYPTTRLFCANCRYEVSPDYILCPKCFASLKVATWKTDPSAVIVREFVKNSTGQFLSTNL